jgi:hypothetical protein
LDLVTGVWDATNQQIRLLVGNDTNPAGAANRVTPAGDVSANGPLLVGSTVTNKSRTGQWFGDIDDPAVFPGVIDQQQLANLFNQSPP